MSTPRPAVKIGGRCCRGCWAAALLASMASFLYPVIRFLNPPPVTEAPVNEVDAGKVQDLKPNSGKIVKFGDKPAHAGARQRDRVEGVFGRMHAFALHRAISRLDRPDLVRLPQRHLRPERQSRLGPAAQSARGVCGEHPRRRSLDFAAGIGGHDDRENNPMA